MEEDAWIIDLLASLSTADTETVDLTETRALLSGLLNAVLMVALFGLVLPC